MFWNRVNGQRVIQVRVRVRTRERESVCVCVCVCRVCSCACTRACKHDVWTCPQAHAPPQPPVIEHPDSGLPTWFCNVHSHSAMLRDERDGVLPETTGASKLNKSDVFYGGWVCVLVCVCVCVCVCGWVRVCVRA